MSLYQILQWSLLCYPLSSETPSQHHSCLDLGHFRQLFQYPHSPFHCLQLLFFLSLLLLPRSTSPNGKSALLQKHLLPSFLTISTKASERTQQKVWVLGRLSFQCAFKTELSPGNHDDPCSCGLMNPEFSINGKERYHNLSVSWKCHFSWCLVACTAVYLHFETWNPDLPLSTDFPLSQQITFPTIASSGSP